MKREFLEDEISKDSQYTNNQVDTFIEEGYEQTLIEIIDRASLVNERSIPVKRIQKVENE